MSAGTPNVLWISTHDINPHLGAYAGTWPGAEHAHTPNLDRLAAQGALYENALAAAPICAPSRSAIITGCYPTAIGTMHMRTKAVPPADVRLLPEIFRSHGYFTTSTSFTDYQVNTPPVVFDRFGDDAHWRDRPDSQTPFFAMFHGMITHESQLYVDDETFAARTSHVLERTDPEEVDLPPCYPDTAVFRRTWARYLDLVSEMDHWVGDLLDQLEEDGLAESTVVVFWSDHGLGMPRAKRWVTESGLREPLIVRWPGTVAAGVRRDEVVQLMDLAPTMLTVCGIPIPESMHAQPFLDADGGFAAPANRYAFAARDRADEQQDLSRSVRDERYRYILHEHPDRGPMQHCDYPDRMATWGELRRLAFDEANELAQGDVPDILTPLQRTLVAPTKPAEELYDVVADPFETTNLAAEPEHAAALDRLRGALAQWRADYPDLGRVPELELMDGWYPGGERRPTAPPVVEPDGTVACATDGAVVGWSDEEPRPGEAGGLARVSGAPYDPTPWRIVRGVPGELPDRGQVWLRAWRIGYEPSDVVVVDRG